MPCKCCNCVLQRKQQLVCFTVRAFSGTSATPHIVEQCHSRGRHFSRDSCMRRKSQEKILRSIKILFCKWGLIFKMFLFQTELIYLIILYLWVVFCIVYVLVFKWKCWLKWKRCICGSYWPWLVCQGLVQL